MADLDRRSQERYNLSQPQVLRWLVQQLLGNAAGAFSVNKLHADLKSRGVAVGKDTLHTYLAHLEDAFLLRSLSLDTDSVGRRQVNPRKVYPMDTGLIPLFDRSGKANTGHALETAVLHELQRRCTDVAYVITPQGYEVGFHARTHAGEDLLIQVATELDDPATLARELRALQDAAVLRPQAHQLLIVPQPPLGAAVPADVNQVEAGPWLLGGPQQVRNQQYADNDTRQTPHRLGNT